MTTALDEKVLKAVDYLDTHCQFAQEVKAAQGNHLSDILGSLETASEGRFPESDASVADALLFILAVRCLGEVLKSALLPAADLGAALFPGMPAERQRMLIIRLSAWEAVLPELQAAVSELYCTE